MKRTILTVLALVLFAGGNVARGDVVVKGIQDENDDGEQYLTNFYEGDPGYELGDGWLVSSDLDLGYDYEPQCWNGIGLQYVGLGIPQGAPINSAKLTFTVDGDQDPQASNDFTIFGEAADNASPFNYLDEAYNPIVPFDISGRARTSASTAWSPTDPAVGVTIDTPDLTGIIQEIVNRPGWSDDNRLTLVIFPDAYLNSMPLTTTVTGHEYEAGPGSDSATLTVDFVPEPATLALLAMAGVGLVLGRKRK